MAGTGPFSYSGMVCQLALPHARPIVGALCGINEFDSFSPEPVSYNVTPQLSGADGSFHLSGSVSVAEGDYGDPPYFSFNIVITKSGFNNDQNWTCPLGAPGQSYYPPPNGSSGNSLQGCLARQGVNATNGLRLLLGPGTFYLRALMGA